MNRQQRRLAQRTGQLNEDGTPEAEARPEEPERPRVAQAQVGVAHRRTTPRQFLHEVNVEMRKVAWPTRAETINYSTVVFVTLAILMGLIFALDLAFSKMSLVLFK